jgi:hypothetical protein
VSEYNKNQSLGPSKDCFKDSLNFLNQEQLLYSVKLSFGLYNVPGIHCPPRAPVKGMNCCSWLAITISPDFIVSQFIVFSFSCSWGGIIYVEEYNPRFGPIHRGPDEGCEWRHCNTWWTLNVPQNWSQVLWDAKRPPEWTKHEQKWWLVKNLRKKETFHCSNYFVIGQFY